MRRERVKLSDFDCRCAHESSLTCITALKLCVHNFTNVCGYFFSMLWSTHVVLINRQRTEPYQMFKTKMDHICETMVKTSIQVTCEELVCDNSNKTELQVLISVLIVKKYRSRG